MNFRKQEKTGKKSGKFFTERKNGRKEGEKENFRKIKIFSGKAGREKRFLEKERKKERNGRMGRAGPDGGRIAGIF